MNRQFALLGLLALLALLFLAPEAMAQNLNDPDGTFDGVLDLVQQQASSWGPTLRGYALGLFWGLAGIQFVWSLFPLVMKGADLGEIVGELIRQVMVIGFFLTLLLFSVDWSTAIVDSLRTAAGVAGGNGGAINPADMFGLAIELGVKIQETVLPAADAPAGDIVGKLLLGGLERLTLFLAGIIIMVCYAFIAAFMAVTLVESYFLINAGVIFMGFGGSQWTRDIAINIIRGVLAVAAKLFVVTLIVSLVQSSAVRWMDAYQANPSNTSLWTMIGLALVCAYMCKTIPELVAGIINGTSLGGGAQIGNFVASGIAAGVAAAAAIKTAGASAVVAGAAKAGGSAALGQALGGAGAAAGKAAGGAGAGVSTAAGTGSPLAGGAGSTVAGDVGSRTTRGGAGAIAGDQAKPGATAGGKPEADKAASSATSSAGGDKGGDKAGGDAGAEKQPAAAGGARPGAHAAKVGGMAAEGVLRSLGSAAAVAMPGADGAPGLAAGLATMSMGEPADFSASPPPGAPPSAGAAPGGGEDNVIRPAEPAPGATPGTTPGEGVKPEAARPSVVVDVNPRRPDSNS